MAGTNETSMKMQKLGSTDLTVSSVVAGCMRIQDMTDAEIRDFVAASRDEGINFFDHADIYGGAPHRCEERFGAAVDLSSGLRDQIVIQTKCGIQPGYFDFSYEHIIESVDQSLAALRTDYIDVLLLHRPDALVEPAEVARAFDELKSAGKVRHFGVSNHTPSQIRLLQKDLNVPLVANQLQLSIAHATMITRGLAVNMGIEQSVDRDGDVLDFCRLEGITVQAWSPFQKGFFDGVFLGDADYPELNAEIDKLAAKYGVTPNGIAVAWITRHPADIQVVLGTTKVDRVRDSARGAAVTLTRPEWYSLTTAAGNTLP